MFIVRSEACEERGNMNTLRTIEIVIIAIGNTDRSTGTESTKPRPDATNSQRIVNEKLGVREIRERIL